VPAPERLVRLCNISELKDGSAQGFDPFNAGRDLLFVVRQRGALKAYLNRCPHQQASLPWRKHEYLNSDGSRIVCSAHGAQFDINSGQCTLGPALGHSLVPISISISESGEVEAHVPLNLSTEMLLLY
jgi:nitrite reductase/ring-hydroxylating ferredoxin subunit